MNRKSDINLKVESPFANLSSNSAVILSGRCTSTPKDSTLPSLKDSEPSCDSIKDKTNTDLSLLNRVIDFAPIPIFGRRNLQLLNNYVNKGVNLLCEEAVGLLLTNEQNSDEYLAKPDIKNKLSNKRKECSKEVSTNITYQLKQDIKESKDQGSRNPYKILRASRVAALRTANCSKVNTKRRKSNQYESKTPVLKISSKCPKSPRLLTAIRAKLKQNRERLHEEKVKAGKALKYPLSSDKKYHERTSKKNEKFETIIKQTKPSTVSRATETNAKKYKTELYKREQTEVHKTNDLKQVKNNIQQQRDNAKKLTPFKAKPIRKYSPLPNVKKRSITIPQSPKLGKRRYLNSYR